MLRAQWELVTTGVKPVGVPAVFTEGGADPLGELLGRYARTRAPFTTHDAAARFGLGQRVAYLWYPEGILKSRLAAAVDRLLGDAVTARNWNTMTKLHALAGE